MTYKWSRAHRASPVDDEDKEQDSRPKITEMPEFKPNSSFKRVPYQKRQRMDPAVLNKLKYTSPEYQKRPEAMNKYDEEEEEEDDFDLKRRLARFILERNQNIVIGSDSEEDADESDPYVEREGFDYPDESDEWANAEEEDDDW